MQLTAFRVDKMKLVQCFNDTMCKTCKKQAISFRNMKFSKPRIASGYT